MMMKEPSIELRQNRNCICGKQLASKKYKGRVCGEVTSNKSCGYWRRRHAWLLVCITSKPFLAFSHLARDLGEVH